MDWHKFVCLCLPLAVAAGIALSAEPTTEIGREPTPLPLTITNLRALCPDCPVLKSSDPETDRYLGLALSDPVNQPGIRAAVVLFLDCKRSGEEKQALGMRVLNDLVGALTAAAILQEEVPKIKNWLLLMEKLREADTPAFPPP